MGSPLNSAIRHEKAIASANILKSLKEKASGSFRAMKIVL